MPTSLLSFAKPGKTSPLRAIHPPVQRQKPPGPLRTVQPGDFRMKLVAMRMDILGVKVEVAELSEETKRLQDGHQCAAYQSVRL